MSAGRSNWRPGPAEDWANRQAMEGREVAWAAIGGPSVNATYAAPSASEDWDAQAADAAAREQDWDDEVSAERVGSTNKPCPYGCVNGHYSQYDYDDTHHNPEG